MDNFLLILVVETTDINCLTTLTAKAFSFSGYSMISYLVELTVGVYWGPTDLSKVKGNQLDLQLMFDIKCWVGWKHAAIQWLVIWLILLLEFIEFQPIFQKLKDTNWTFSWCLISNVKWVGNTRCYVLILWYFLLV